MNLHTLEKTRRGVHLQKINQANGRRPGVIMDRDGVLVEFVNYLHDPEFTQLLPDAIAFLKAMQSKDVAIGVATNQSGIARALYKWEDYLAVDGELSKQLSRAGVTLDAVAACPYHPDFTSEWSQEHSYWRKPGPGMVKLLMTELNIIRDRCWMIGDHLDDIKAAQAAHLKGAILLRRGRGKVYQDVVKKLSTSSFEVHVLDDLLQAMPILENRLRLCGATNRLIGESS